MKEKTERRLWGSTGLAVAIVGILAGILTATVVNVVNDVVFEPKIKAEVDTTPIDNMTAELESMTSQMENASKTWHLTFKGQNGVVASDLTEPFYLKGEKALITWTPLLDRTGNTAYLCPVDNANCGDRNLVREEGNEFDILTGELSEGWYVVRITDSTGWVEVYIYY